MSIENAKLPFSKQPLELEVSLLFHELIRPLRLIFQTTFGPFGME